MLILDKLLFLAILKMYFIRSNKSATSKILIKFILHLLLLFILYIYLKKYFYFKILKYQF